MPWVYLIIARVLWIIMTELLVDFNHRVCEHYEVKATMTVPPDRLAKILMAFLPDILKEFIETDAP